MLALLSVALLCVHAAPARKAGPIPPELETLRATLKHTERVSARFKQTRHWAALQDGLKTEGRFEYRKGGRLLWHTDPPAESDLVLEGQTASIRYPALGTTQTIDFSSEPGIGKVFESIRAVLQADLERLQSIFKLTIERKAPLTLALTPKSKELARVVHRIRLTFDAQLRLVQVVLEEGAGDWTEIVFTEHAIEMSKP
ncbi:MAG TPA: outer membrane lipoprotein carrier protein LolA [Myxococcaceae bacterium]|nr:outer membrane lipoprotein carrier protein LolA [Myxococcaceae bacterium]